MAIRAERRQERASPSRTLVTPEGVTLPLELADAGQRAGGFLIDLLIIFGGSALVTILLLLLALSLGSPIAAEVIVVCWMIGGFLLRNFYFTWFEAGAKGATPGKRMLGMRVIARHGGRLTLDAVIARNAMREVEAFLPITFLLGAKATGGIDGLTMTLGFLWSAIFLFLPVMNRDRLRAGDLLAGTWVIRAPRRPLLPELAVEESEAEFSDAELDAYGVYELEALEKVIRQPRTGAVETVAEAIRRRIGRSPHGDGGGDGDLAFLRAYYAALRRRLEQRMLFGKRRADKFDRP